MNADTQKAKTIVDSALQFPVPERRAFVAGACGTDEALRMEVEKLLFSAPSPDTVSTVGPVHEKRGAVIGRYKLIDKLGEGGFGSVWVAEQREPVRRRVALKIIKLGMDTKQVVARFDTERQALALMDHPNIARVLDAGTTDTGRPYFVMDLVKGLPITKYCDQERLDLRQRLNLFIKVCLAIQHAHQKGIIHRDIKPSNILVTLNDGEPVPKVIDFGIAKATQQELTERTVYTQFHQFIGTPAYVSPEQAEMSMLDIDTRSDIYSLGVLLYELLTGTTPFDARELMQSGIDEMRKIIREREPVRPSRRLLQQQLKGDSAGASTHHPTTIPSDLDWIVMKCLEKNHTRRYDTANGLIDDLKRHLNNEPVQARPPSTVYRFQKAFRRHRLTFTAGAAVLAALVLGLGVATIAFLQESNANKELSIAEQEQIRLRKVADEQRDLARARLYETLLREARSIRQARQPGYREHVFDRLRQALELNTPNADLDAVRREASFCFGDWIGLNPVDFQATAKPGADALLEDGTLAAIGDRNGTVTLIEVSSGRTLSSVATGGRPESLAFDSESMNLYVVTSPPDGGPEKQDPIRGLEKWRSQGPKRWVREWQRPVPGLLAVQASDDGPLALSYDPDRSVIVVSDLRTDGRIASLSWKRPLAGQPRAVVSDDRRLLALFSQPPEGNFDMDVEVWDLPAGKLFRRLQPKLGPGVGLYFGPDGHSLVCTFDNSVVLFDLESEMFGANLGGSFAETTGAGVGGSGPLLAVPSYQEQTVYLIQSATGAEVAAVTIPGQPLGVRFSRDGGVLLVRHESGCRIVRLEADGEKRELRGHVGGVPAMEFSPDGTRLLSVGKDRTLRMWDVNRRSNVQIVGQLSSPGQSLAVRATDGLAACGFYDSDRISIWLPESDQPLLGDLNTPSSAADITWSCSFSPDGHHLAAVGDGLRIWELPGSGDTLKPGNAPARLLLSEPRGDANVVFDPAGRRLAYIDILEGRESFATGLFLRDLDPQSAPSLLTTNAQSSLIQVFDVLPKSGDIIYATPDRGVVVMNPDTRESVRSFTTLLPGEKESTYIANLRVSPDEKYLATVSASGLGANVWDLSTGRHLVSLPDASGSIWWLAWSPDSKQLAVSRANGDIAIWNLPEIESQLALLKLDP